MPKLNHKNIGEVQKHAYLKGTILAVYGSSEEDPEHWDTVDITVEDGTSGLKIPLFYHCSHDAVLRDNGALEGASAAFAEDDEVFVQCEITSDRHYKPLRVMGFMDKPKVCGGWIEDWEGATTISNHLWQGIDDPYIQPSYPCCVDWSAGADLVNFEDEKMLRVEHRGSASGCNCEWTLNPYVDLRLSPEEPVDLGELTGFEGKIYIESLSPQNLSGCAGNCTPAWVFNFTLEIGFGWRLKGHSNWADDWTYYRRRTGVSCWYDSRVGHCVYYETVWGGTDTWSEFIAKIGVWQELERYPDNTPVPWGNSDYELTYVDIYHSLFVDPSFVSRYGSINMTVYHSDIKLI